MSEAQKIYVVRSKTGLTLAEVVSRDGVNAVIRRLVGQKFRLGRQKLSKSSSVPVNDIIREASHRELVLGHPV